MNITAASLFSGIGGLELGLEALGIETIWQCENDLAASLVLNQHWPDLINLGDITAVDWTDIEAPDLVVGGFPCQDISWAGKGAGLDGQRSGLWREYARAIRALRPHYVLVENVDALFVRGLGTVLGDLAALGYDTRWFCVRASDVGAPHRRQRVFIIAANTDYRTNDGQWPRKESGPRGQDAPHPISDPIREQPKSFAGSISEAESGISLCDPDIESGEERRVAASRQTQSGRPWTHAGRSGRAPVADPESIRRREGMLSVRGAETFSELRDDSDQETLPNTETPERRGSQRHAVGKTTGSTTEPGERTSQATWGPYLAAVERWERQTRPAPSPASPAGKLNPEFVEWMMGFPEGWTADLPRKERLKCLGNAVVPQVAELVSRHIVETP